VQLSLERTIKMLKKTFVVMSALSLVALAGCTKSSADAPAAQPQAPTAGDQSQTAQTEEHREIAPLVVKLIPVSENAATGETELRADFDAREKLPYPITITLVPPAGALIVSGNQTETMDITSAGRFSKSFKIRVQAPLTAQAPVKVVVHGVAADKSAGLHAEPQYPAVVETTVPPRQGPSVPGGRPPLPARR
jgi:glucose/arabinose dehydrogenase